MNDFPYNGIRSRISDIMKPELHRTYSGTIMLHEA